MRKDFVSIGAAMVAILVVVSAGCVAPSPAGNSSAIAPAKTTGENGLGIPALTVLPGYVPAATPVMTFPAGSGTGDLREATAGDTVSVYYTGTFENGTVFDSNVNGTGPAVFTLGNLSVIQGFEDAVTGMSVNEEKTVTIPYDKAYGAYDPGLVRTVNRTGPIANTTFVEGETYSIRDKTTGNYSFVRVIKVMPTTITWDANNPLAGLNFTFTIKLVNITRQ
jgi:FKBP-type peptidyl-prolyl cis-trans isomerase 2